MKEHSPVLFLADAMVGRLGRWLRILGYDVTTFHRDSKQANRSRNRIIEQARSEKRLILTRDTYLLKRNNLPPHIFIKNDHPEEQFHQVLQDLNMEPSASLSRCLDCNFSLKQISKGAVKKRVPPYVFQTQSDFSQCPRCEKIYWEGTHVKRMIERIKQFQTK
ncbi:MAG TPA: Mut7-C RNAse domain-containing protein [Nitrospiria bacterium]|jgi:uncharacterized protein with PIN domain